jgi:hypothetical protein
MSVKSVVAKLTVKFESDVQKFFVWADEKEYVIKDIDNNDIDWSLDLLKTINFIEPGRNKLEGFIAAVKDTYNVYRGKTKVDDAKLLARDFKEAPIEKKTTKKAKDESTEEAPKKVKAKKVKKESEDEEVEVEKPVKKATKAKAKKVVEDEEEVEDEKPVKKATKAKKVVEEIEIVVKVDMTLDTLNTEYLDTLEYWSADLVKAFGRPKKTGDITTDHVYEWKVQVNNSIFSIYDWHNEEEFNDITWYISGFGDYKKNTKNLGVLTDYIDEFCSKDIEIKLDFENLGDSDEDEE